MRDRTRERRWGEVGKQSRKRGDRKRKRKKMGIFVFIPNLMPATHSKKVGAGACLPLCYITFPFNST